MTEALLVASHVSSLPRPPPASIIVSTTRTNAPLPSNAQLDLPDEHALFSSVLHNEVTGTIVLRVIHGGTILELMSLSVNVSPLRFVLPATILPSPGLFIWEQSSLHILLVTDIGSIFRLIVPINGLKLWQEHLAGDGITFRESYLFHPSIQDIRLCNIHAQGIDSLAVSVPNGGLMRLESDFFSWNEQQEEQWTDTLFHHTSFFSSLTSLLHSSVPGASDIISMASHPWPTDVANVWSLSRDRTLRLWKAKLGCVASKSLPITPSKHEESKSNLLDQEYQNLVKVFSQSTGELFNVYALVFIPTPTTQSGGFFTLFDTSSDQLIELGAIQCPKNTSRCHLQDFAVRNGRLYALWDRQGQAFISSTEIDFASMSTFEPQTHVWNTAEYAETLDLTPAYMEERLLAPGSMTSIFLDAILKPGVFSALTLRTALDRYTDSCLSVPGAPPPQLLSTYGSLCENIAAVVGCTVTLNRDPQTGGYQHANYWTALKRDWEGFVARCKEVERNARWPLSIAVTGDGNVIFVERERIGSLYVEDVPLGYHRLLERDKPLHLDHALFETMWGLRCKLGPHALATLEMRMTDVMKQEMAFSFSEVLQDQADRLNFQDSLEEGAKEWFDERLRSIVNIDQAIRGALDSIGALDLAVKPEETDSMSLDAVEPPAWHRTQAVGYASATVRARYDLCLSLIVFLLFIADDLSHWEPSLLTEIFAVFRGIATLRYSANRSIEGDRTSPPNPQSSTDDVVAQMRNMNVSNSSKRIPLKTSLLQLLISQTPVAETVPVTAHNFLDSTGILQSLSTAYVTKHEAAFCNHVLALGLLDASRELLSWLPRTPAATFLQAQVFLRFGRPDDAAELLEKLAGCFGVGNLGIEDSDALAAVLPNLHPIDSEYAFYVFAANLFQPHSTRHEVRFSQLALQTAPSDVDTSPLWKIIVKGLMDLKQYRDAYATLMATPFHSLQLEFAKQLANRMCEDNAMETLITLDFPGITDTVSDHLAFKARTRSPLDKPCYSQILYTWYTRRGDYRNASLTMYQRATKLQALITDIVSFGELAEQQLDALSIAINALHLVDEKMAWFIIKDSSRRKLKAPKYVPEAKFVSGEHDELVSLPDLEHEYVLLQIQIDMIRKRTMDATEFPLAPPVIVVRLARASQYTQALSIASSLDLDMTDIFIHLTNQCVRLSRNPGAILQEDTSDWLLTDNSTSWTGVPSDRGWRFLHQALKRHDNAETDYRYGKAVLETILTLERSTSPPRWLIDNLQSVQPEYLIRVSLRYENLQDAINYTYALVLQSDKQNARQPSKNASTTWLPYALIDQVLVAAEAEINPPTHLADLKSALNNRIKRIQKA